MQRRPRPFPVCHPGRHAADPYRHATGPSRRAFTPVGVLVVLGLVVLLAGFLLPAVRACYEMSRRDRCGNQQRTLALAMGVYASEHGGRLPVALADTRGRLVARDDPSRDALATAGASLELLAWTSQGDLGRRDVACPLRPDARPRTEEQPVAQRSAWVADVAAWSGYAYDWSAPPTPPARRVLTADRQRGAHRARWWQPFSGPQVLVAFADGHVGAIARRDGTYAIAGDDLYSAAGDGPMDEPGGGSAMRCFVR